MNMKPISVVKPLYIYHGCSAWRVFWEKTFALGEFTPVNMKICGRHNVRKEKEIKYGERYISLEIALNFDSLEKIKITYS